jgi:hypothetical protein
MKTTGIFTAIGGVCCLIFAVFMDTAAPPASILDDSRILNLGLLQNQMMVWQLGLALLIAGAVLYVGGSLQERGSGAYSHAAPEAETDPETTYTDPHAKGDETIVWIVVWLIVLVSAAWLFAAWLGFV